MGQVHMDEQLMKHISIPKEETHPSIYIRTVLGIGAPSIQFPFGVACGFRFGFIIRYPMVKGLRCTGVFEQDTIMTLPMATSSSYRIRNNTAHISLTPRNNTAQTPYLLHLLDEAGMEHGLSQARCGRSDLGTQPGFRRRSASRWNTITETQNKPPIY